MIALVNNKDYIFKPALEFICINSTSPKRCHFYGSTEMVPFITASERCNAYDMVIVLDSNTKYGSDPLLHMLLKGLVVLYVDRLDKTNRNDRQVLPDGANYKVVSANPLPT